MWTRTEWSNSQESSCFQLPVSLQGHVQYIRRRRQSSSFWQDFLGWNDELPMLESSHAMYCLPQRYTFRRSSENLQDICFEIYFWAAVYSQRIKERTGYLLKWFYIDTTLARVVNLIIELNYEHSIQMPGAGLPYWFLGLSLQVHIRVTMHYY